MNRITCTQVSSKNKLHQVRARAGCYTKNRKPNHDLLANKYNHKVSQFYNQPCPKYHKHSQIITLGSPKKVLDSYAIGHRDFIYDDPLETYHLDDICFPEESEKMPKVPNDRSNQLWVSPKDSLLNWFTLLII